MKQKHALAAGQGGNGNVSQSQPSAEDEAQRRSTVRELAGYLARGAALLDRCETLASAKRGNRLGPILAASRLLYANAQVAKVLAQVALVESRRRTIVETVQPYKPTPDELLAQDIAQAQADDDAHAQLERRLDELLEASRAKTAREEALAAAPP